MAEIKQRERTFDIMKGIGILLVMICHFWGWNHPILSKTINSFHMPMFFIIAGYFSKSYSGREEAWTSIKKYFRRLCIPLLFTQLLIAAWAVLMAVTKGGGWDPAIRESLSLFWADPHGPLTPWGQLSIGVIWFLGALFVAKTLLLHVISKQGRWAFIIAFTLAVSAFLLHKVFHYSIWCISLGLVALPFVTMGWWLKSHSLPPWTKVLAIGCWLLAISVSSLGMYDFEWEIYPLDVVGACGGTYVLYLLSKLIDLHLKYVSKWLAYLGVLSLAIMCVHAFEISSHMGNHLKALVGMDLSLDGLGIWRLFVTLAMAILLVHIPKVKKLFV